MPVLTTNRNQSMVPVPGTAVSMVPEYWVPVPVPVPGISAGYPVGQDQTPPYRTRYRVPGTAWYCSIAIALRMVRGIVAAVEG